MKEKLINWLIKTLKADTNKISDGYHTFEELYEHRIELWITVCSLLTRLRGVLPGNPHLKPYNVWFTKKHSDGIEWEGWFILGVGSGNYQMTYHLPEKYWHRGDIQIRAELKERAPKYDGHTPKDVIERLKNL